MCTASTARPLFNAQVDYALSPTGRRSGKEVPPSSLSRESVNTNFLTQAVIGSLPKGLTPAEREAVAASTPLSPSLNLLNSLPRGQLHQRTAQATALRRSVLRGSVIVFITAGYSGKRFIFERAKELGVRSIVVDGPDSWAIEMERDGTIEKFVPLDMSESDTVLERCLEAIKEARAALGGDLDGVVSFSEMAQPLVARLAEKLGLPGPAPSVVDAARDKHATRQCMAAAGLPTPRNLLIEKEEDLAAAAKHVGFPAVIKPIYGAASIGVLRVDSEEALRTGYARVRRELASASVVDGALLGGDAAGDAEPEGNADTWIQTTVMMEEYLDGPEVDVDLVMSEGQAVYGAVTDNWPTLEPYFNETGSNSPSILPSQQQRELLDLALRSVQALGFEAGVFHVECKYTSRGARLIEVNCRMGGGPVRNMNLMVWGVDLVEEALLAVAGIPSRPNVAPKPLRYIGEYLLNAQKTGVLGNLDFLKEFEARKGVLMVKPLVAEGSKVVCVEDGLPTWIVEIIVEADSGKGAVEAAEALEKEISARMPIS